MRKNIIFHILQLDQKNTKKEQIDKAIFKLESEIYKNSKEYKVKVIYNNKVYIKESNNSHYLSKLYYLILWKNYSRKKNI